MLNNNFDIVYNIKINNYALENSFSFMHCNKLNHFTVMGKLSGPPPPMKNL